MHIAEYPDSVRLQEALPSVGLAVPNRRDRCTQILYSSGAVCLRRCENCEVYPFLKTFFLVAGAIFCHRSFTVLDASRTLPSVSKFAMSHLT